MHGAFSTPFGAKSVLRRFSGPRIGSVGASSFVDHFVSCWGKRGVSVAAFTHLNLASYFVACGGLIVCR